MTSLAPPPLAAGGIRFETFELDSRAGELHRRGRRIRLQEKPLRVLQLLLARPGELVTREELQQALWPEDTYFDVEGGLNTAVNKLRSALGDTAEKPRYVETVGRRGYRFIAEVQPVPVRPVPVQPVESSTPGGADRPTPATRTGDAAGEPAAARSRKWRLEIRLLAAVLVLATTAAAWLWWQRSSPRPPRIQSLAVLPLADLSAQHDQEYLADGLADALITDLARMSSLRVISRQSVMRYKRSTKALPEIARELGVDGIIEGSVVRSGGRVRVTTQLLHGPTDRHLWAQSYERDADDVIGLQDEIARSVAGAVDATLVHRASSRVAPSRPASAETYELYLRGRYHFEHRYDGDLAESLRQSVHYLEQAVAREPDYALAHAALAEVYAPLGYHALVPPEQATTAMRAHALRALELDPTLPEAHTALAACLSVFEWSWAAGEREFQRAIALDPQYATARVWYSLHLGLLGRATESLEQARIGREGDPYNLLLALNEATALDQLGRPAEAESLVRWALDLEPGATRLHSWLGGFYLRRGEIERARVEFEASRWPLGQALAAGRAGDPRRLREILAGLRQQSSQRYVSPRDLAAVHAALGEKDAAFAELERAFRTRVPALSQLRVDYTFESLHGDPRFDDLLRRVGVATRGPIS